MYPISTEKIIKLVGLKQVWDNTVVGLAAVVELPRNVERVVRDEGERRVGVGVVAQLLQLEHVHRPVQRHFGP